MSANVSPGSPRTPWCVWAFFALVFVPYACVFPYQNVNNPNENVRLYMTMALVEQHTFQIDALVDRYGWVNDMARLAGRDGVEHDYSLKAPGTSYAGVPFYWAFTKVAGRMGHPIPAAGDPPEAIAWWKRESIFVLRLFVVQLPAFAFLIWFERWLRGVTKDVALRLAALAATGLGTTYLAYALMFVSHTLAAVMTFTSFGLLAREWVNRGVHKRGTSPAFVAGLFAGMATLVEYQAFPLSVLLALFAVFTFRRIYPLLAFGLGAAPSACALCFFQWRCFGSPFAAGYKSAENSDFAEWHRRGFYGLTRVDWAVFKDLSLDRTFGFFSTSPFMGLSVLALLILVAPFEARPARTLRVPVVVALAMMLTLWTMISSAVNWRGGWTLGPRLLGAAPPFFAFGAVAGLEWVASRARWVRAAARGLATGLSTAGVFTLGLVAMLYNSVPEDVVRPLRDFAVPLARSGFVPYQVTDFVGWHSALLFCIPVGCAVAASLVSLLVNRERGSVPVALRLLFASFAFDAGMLPAFAATDGDQQSVAADWRKQFSKDWVPTGRDAVATGRARAEEASRGGDGRAPCLWLDLSGVERSLGWAEEADSDLQRSIGESSRWSPSDLAGRCRRPIRP
jgi:hypothetical protein